MTRVETFLAEKNPPLTPADLHGLLRLEDWLTSIIAATDSIEHQILLHYAPTFITIFGTEWDLIKNSFLDTSDPKKKGDPFLTLIYQEPAIATLLTQHTDKDNPNSLESHLFEFLVSIKSMMNDARKSPVLRDYLVMVLSQITGKH